MNWKKTISGSLSFFGYTKRAIKSLIKKGEVPILAFHRITPNYDLFTQPLHPDELHSLLSELLEYFQFEKLSSLLGDSKKGSICITFDDATDDFYEFAWPVLKELHIPVTLFVPVDSVSSGNPIWNYHVLGL